MGEGCKEKKNHHCVINIFCGSAKPDDKSDDQWDIRPDDKCKDKDKDEKECDDDW